MVLFTTGYARTAIVYPGRRDPGIKLISKQFTAAALAIRIRRAVGQDLGRAFAVDDVPLEDPIFVEPDSSVASPERPEVALIRC